MNIKETMEDLSKSFVYQRFQKAILQDPPDEQAIRAAIAAMCQAETEVLNPIFEKIALCNCPKIHMLETKEAKIKVVKNFSETPHMKRVYEAVDRWRREFMPDWHKWVERMKKAKEEIRGAQP